MDPTLTLQRLTYALDSRFAEHVDLSDVEGEPEERQRDYFLTRALAAFCVNALTDAEPEEASRSVTDGHKDQGIDAIYFDSGEKTLYIVQAKWSKNASKTIEEGDCLKFIGGIRALIRADFSGFNAKIRKREPEMRANLLERSDVRVVLVVAYTGPQGLTASVQKYLDDFLEQQNNVGEQEVFILEPFNLKRLYQQLTGSASGKKVNLTIALKDWGSLEVPYRAYYGSIKLSDIAAWAPYGKPLLARNIRFYRGTTEVNDAIEKSILKTPEQFWYFNNGITILCNKVQKQLINADGRDFGFFDCEGVSIVNGAQTVGVIWELNRREPSFLNMIDARVHVRLISLENCPEDFQIDVTRATNTQNRIQNRDFAALDPTQQRLAVEMELDGLRYAFKSGDADPQNGEGCNIEEATVALACASNDMGIVVEAKRAVGALWQDIAKPPYTTLFNEQLNAPRMWRAVQISRENSKWLAAIDKSPLPRGDLLAIHGNRFILHRVFADPQVSRYRNPNTPMEEILVAVRAATDAVIIALANLVEEKYPNAYLANLFKNTQKCKTLDWYLNNPGMSQDPQPEPQPDAHPRPSLFDLLPDPPDSSHD